MNEDSKEIAIIVGGVVVVILAFLAVVAFDIYLTAIYRECVL